MDPTRRASSESRSASLMQLALAGTLRAASYAMAAHNQPIWSAALTIAVAALVLCGCGQPSSIDDQYAEARERRFNSEADLEQGAYESTILPYYLDEATDRSTFEGKGGVPISYAVFEASPERAAIVVINGRRESHSRYAEWIWDMRGRGYSLYLIDHRGQGLSGRLLDDPEKGHVERFDDYVEDLATFVDQIVGEHEQTFALAHSMGGAILALYALQHPDTFDAYAFSAPMFQIVMPFEEDTTLDMVSVLPDEAYVPSVWIDWLFGSGLGGPYDPNVPFAGNELTTSEARFGMVKDGFAMFPQTRLGAPTNRWMREAIVAGQRLRPRASELSQPMLLLQDLGDTVVDTQAHRDFCSLAPQCALLALEQVVEQQTGAAIQQEARHQILTERDQIRDVALHQLLGFFEEPERYIDGLVNE